MGTGSEARDRRRGARRRVLVLALLGLALPAVSGPCRPRVVFPPLLASEPSDGASAVPRSVWPVLRFDGAISVAIKDALVLVCDGVPRTFATHLLAPDALVVNPSGLLPPAAACTLGFPSAAGPTTVSFGTAAAGPAARVVYDRRNLNRPLPFPDDYWLVPDGTTATGLRPDIQVPNHSTAVSGLLGVMAGNTVALDGFSPIGNLAVQLDAAPDPASLPLDQEASLDPLAPVGLFDLTPGSATYGERVPFKLTVRSDTLIGQPTTHALVLFPGIPLRPTGRYGLVVTNRALSAAGEPFGPSAFFAEVLGGPAPGADPEVVRAAPLAEEVVDALEALGSLPIPRDDVALAVRVTVRSTDTIPDDVLAMRAQVVAAPASWTVDFVEPGFGDVAATVYGTFEAPSWRVGPHVTRDAAGLPEATGTLTLPFILTLPRAAEDAPAPIVMYQHGNPGSAENEVPFSAFDFAPGGFAVAGFTDVLNRTYASVDVQSLAIFGVVLATGNPPDFYIQTYGEQLAFLKTLRAMGTLDVLPLGAPDGVPDLDTTSIVYEGISYGSAHGQAFLAYAPEILAAGLVVGAPRLGELLEYQDRTRPLGGQSFLTQVLPTFVSGVRPEDIWTGLALFQMVYDRQDPHNHAAFLYRDPRVIDGTTKKSSILVLEGINDSFTKNNSTRSLAWLLGPIPHLAPTVVPVSYLPVATAPIQANVAPDTTAAFVQFAPDGIPGIPPSPGCVGQFEGHYCPQGAPEAVALRAGFYRSAVDLLAPIIAW